MPLWLGMGCRCLDYCEVLVYGASLDISYGMSSYACSGDGVLGVDF